MELTYTYYDSRYPNTYSRRCIDGSTVGCNKCVGYCQYEGHEGFLTEKHRKAHDCLGKECFHYLPKPRAERRAKMDTCTTATLKDGVAEILTKFEGLRPMHIELDTAGICLIEYITISNAYIIPEIEREISNLLGKPAKMVKLDYDFDRVVQLLLN